jgi:hypothetical protein
MTDIANLAFRQAFAPDPHRLVVPGHLPKLWLTAGESGVPTARI